MIKPIFVVPTYWTHGQYQQNDVVYDHPTDLQNPVETISKTLKSFEVVKGEFDVLVIGAPARTSIGEEMDNVVMNIISDADLSYPTKYFGSKEYEQFILLIKETDIGKYSNLISNNGYGNIRNLCLLIPHILDYDIAILIDDDELIIDPLFLHKATEFIGSRIQNKILGLIVGYYTNPDGSIFVDETNVPRWNFVWEKERLMNQAFQIITDLESERLVDTPFAFGGNMVIHRNCWAQVPFDPQIARGEDMDFLRNIKYFGFEGKLDRSLSIRHEPPPSPPPSKSSNLKFHQDIRRFMYSKYKLEHMRVDASEYDPYPGYFLHQTEGKVILTELLEYIFHNKDQLIESTNVNQMIEQIQNIEFYFDEIKDECQNLSSSYFSFQKRWKNLLLQLNSFPLPSKIISEV